VTLIISLAVSCDSLLFGIRSTCWLHLRETHDWPDDDIMVLDELHVCVLVRTLTGTAAMAGWLVGWLMERLYSNAGGGASIKMVPQTRNKTPFGPWKLEPSLAQIGK